jgi:PA14 domain
VRRAPVSRSFVMLVACLALAAAPACEPTDDSIGAVFTEETGLTAEYFDGLSLQRRSGTYRDANIDFEGWELNARIESRGHRARTFSIRWTGQMRFEPDEIYVVSFELRGRVRLWIDGDRIIDDWTDGGDLREAWGFVPASEDEWRYLRIDWDQVDGPMTARLRAASESRPRAIVAPGALRDLDL